MAYIGKEPTAVPLSASDLNDDIISLAKMAAGTDGNLITYDASGNPVAVATGSDGQILTSAGAGQPCAFEASAGGGKLLQALIGSKTDTETLSGNADTWTDLSDLTVTTGSLATTSSRCWVQASVHMVGDEHIAFKIVTGAGADITDFIGDTASSRTRATCGTAYRANDDMNYCYTGTGIHSPSSTSAQTYKVQYRCSSAAVVNINKRNGDADDQDNFQVQSSITVFEIGA